jgi:hypothetical protein
MADENISKEYVYDSETEELVVLESNWYQDYSKPPIVNRVWSLEKVNRNQKCLMGLTGQWRPS